jgi:general secretion pathway protein A
MYERFFGLRERPFDLTPNPRFLFLSARQREALNTLKYALSCPSGLTVLLGEAGTGKTTLVHAAVAGDGTGKSDVDVQCVLMSNPTLTRDEFYEFLTEAFALPDAAGSKSRFLGALRRHVEARHARGQLTALVIDEAQSLPYEILEEVRLLSNIETTTTKLLSVVLAGQPELADRLNDSRLRQLKQRIGLRCELTVFDLPETAAYMAGRLRTAGGVPVDIFTRDAVCAVFEGSGGIARVINVIAQNALLGGFGQQIKPVSRAIVEEVCRDFDLTPSSGPHPAGQSTPTEGANDDIFRLERQPEMVGRVLGIFAQKGRAFF